MNDERYERSADMRLLELQREALGVPAHTVRIRKYADFDPLPEVYRDDDDDGRAQHGPLIVATLDAVPRRGLIAGAVVTISLAVANEGDVSARGLHVSLSLPVDAVYRSDSFVVDGRPGDDAVALDLLETGVELGDLEPSERRTFVLKISLEAALGDVIVSAHVRVSRGAILGPRALRLTRGTPSSAAPAAERPFYEESEESADDEPPVAAEQAPPAVSSTAKWRPDPVLHSEPERPPVVPHASTPAAPPKTRAEQALPQQPAVQTPPPAAPQPADASTAALAQSIRDAIRRVESVRDPVETAPADGPSAAPLVYDLAPAIPAPISPPAPIAPPASIAPPAPIVTAALPSAPGAIPAAPATRPAEAAPSVLPSPPRSGPSEAARRLIAEAAKRLQAQTAAASAPPALQEAVASSAPPATSRELAPPAVAPAPVAPAPIVAAPIVAAPIVAAPIVAAPIVEPPPVVPVSEPGAEAVTSRAADAGPAAAPDPSEPLSASERKAKPSATKPAKTAGRRSKASAISTADTATTPASSDTPSITASKTASPRPPKAVAVARRDDAAKDPAIEAGRDEVPPAPRKALKPLFPQTISGLNRDVPQRPPARPTDTKSRVGKRGPAGIAPTSSTGEPSAPPPPRNLRIVPPMPALASIRLDAHGGPVLSVHLDRKRLATLTMLFSGPSLGMIAHYLVLNALAAKDALPGQVADPAIGTFIAQQERLLSRALITTRLGKAPTAESLSAPLPPFPPAVPPVTGTCEVGVPVDGLLLVRAFQPTDIAFLRRTLANEKASPFLRAAQLFVGLCANDAAVSGEAERRPVGAALAAYAALATAEISRIFLRSKLNAEPVLFKATDAALDDTARAVLDALARTLR